MQYLSQIKADWKIKARCSIGVSEAKPLAFIESGLLPSGIVLV